MDMARTSSASEISLTQLCKMKKATPNPSSVLVGGMIKGEALHTTGVAKMA